jgi:hypothetical protein
MIPVIPIASAFTAAVSTDGSDRDSPCGVQRNRHACIIQPPHGVIGENRCKRCSSVRLLTRAAQNRFRAATVRSGTSGQGAASLAARSHPLPNSPSPSGGRESTPMGADPARSKRRRKHHNHGLSALLRVIYYPRRVEHGTVLDGGLALHFRLPGRMILPGR